MLSDAPGKCVKKLVVCKTETRACVFPFNYKNEQYHGCTRADKNGGYTDPPWCAFKVKANGDMSNWDRCDVTTCAGTFYNKFL